MTTTSRADVRHALRALRKRPLFAVAVVATLALGIGANTAIFSLVRAALLRPLPYSDPDQLVQITAVRGGEPGELSQREMRDMREQLSIFDHVAAYAPGAAYNMSGEGPPEEVSATLCTSNLMETLGVPLLRGQFWPEDYDRSRNFGVVLNHDFWKRRWGGDPSIVGKKITLDSAPFYTVFGILSPGVHFPSRVDLLRSHGIAHDPDAYESRANRNRLAVGRLRAGIDPGTAQAELDALAKRLERDHPDTNRGISFRITPLRDLDVGNLRPYLWLLMAAVVLVLLTACVNAASLLLSRGLEREREVAIRTALGASRRDLIRMFLTESVLLAVVAGAAGLLLAHWAATGLAHLVEEEMPWWVDVRIDGHVLAFTLLVSLVTGVLAGLAPAFRGRGPRLEALLRDGARGSAGPARQRARRLLVAGEIALALILLVGAGLMVKSFRRAQDADLGFRPERLLTFRIALPWSTYDPEKSARFYDQLLDELEALPGVEAVSVNSNLPMTGDGEGDGRSVSIEGQSADEARRNPFVAEQRVGADYFGSMEIPLLTGRRFDERDRAGTTDVAVVSQSMAERFWPGQDPLGKRLKVEVPELGPSAPPRPWLTVVGVVGDVRQEEVSDRSSLALYVPYRQKPTNNQYVLLRSSVDPATLGAAATRVVWSVDPRQSTFDLRTMETRIAGTIWQRRVSGLLFAAFAALGLVLAAIGIYGVMSYTVGQRTREIGIRMALGARIRDVVGLVVLEAMKPVLIGIAVGLAGALALSRLMKALLFEVSSLDPLTFAGSAGLLAAVALLACIIPAGRAARVDPMTALRHE